jgi:YHS domain-containing protein
MKIHRFILLSLIVISTLSVAQEKNLRTAHFNLKGTLAIKGYDPVSYFLQNKVTKGNANLSYEYEGVTYYFSTLQNKQTFIKQPSKYEPEFGGWCAYAMGLEGKKVSINPETFKIIDEKLYLFYNAFGTNTLVLWNKNESHLKANAKSNWTSIFK